MLKTSKVLCLGNSTRSTDELTTHLATVHESINYGLITDPETVITNPGFYHSTVSDMEVSHLAKLGKQFNKIFIFDQSIDSFDEESLYHKTRQVGMLIQNRYKVEVEIVSAKTE